MSDIQLGVSLYSYGGDFMFTMSLEDCLADVADMGATGLEILADTHIPSYPTPAPAWIDEWQRLLERYSLTPTCYSSWLDTRLHAGRDLDLDSAVRILARDLDLAHQLGFTLLRPKIGVVSQDLLPDPIWRETVKRCLQKAADYDIRIVPEIHAPTRLKSEIVNGYLSLISETGTEHFGLLIDTGIFQREPRPAEHSDSIYRFGPPDPEAIERADSDMRAPLGERASDLEGMGQHVLHVHAKFWDMTDSHSDPHIPYDEVVQALIASGYRGWISSEYEGNREPGRAGEVLRYQQLMLRRLLAEGSDREADPRP